MTDFSYELKIPKERVAVLIGKRGKEKTFLEDETKTRINVDSKEGDVVITGNDAISLFSAREMIKAIGRGFNPEAARLLLKQDYVFESINLADFVKTKDHLKRIKGRIIGSSGKSRKVIEELSESEICVYGKTVSMIGYVESCGLARKAIEMLLRGSTHATVYRWLEKERGKIKTMKFTPP